MWTLLIRKWRKESMLNSMNPDAVLNAFISDPDPKLVSPFMLRLSRNLNSLQSTLDSILVDPLDRASCGVGTASEDPPGTDLASDIRWAQARLDEGVPVPSPWCAALEQRAKGELEHWVPAARIYASAHLDRERQVRMALSEQSLPYVFPGTLDPLQVHLLAAGERVLPALHVDWVRKLSAFVLEALLLDLKFAGGWFWPVLEVLDGRRAVRDVRRMMSRPRQGPGGRGMMAAYLVRLGEPPENLASTLSPMDQLVLATAIIGERPT